jgi:transposase
MTKAEHDIKRKLAVLNHAEEIGNISKACRYFGISRQVFYKWKRLYQLRGDIGLINGKPCPSNPKLRMPAAVVEKIIYLRKTYHLGQLRISWFLERYHGIKVSATGIHNVLKRNGLNRLPRNAKTRSVQIHRYEKQVPGHHIQVDVKFLKFIGPTGS